jgi:Transcription factor WhiB
VQQKHFGLSTGGINAPYFDGTQVCAQTDPDMFFPDNPAETKVYLKLVRPLCNRCEFQAPCIEYALEHSELMGIWAGTTQKERQRIRGLKKRAT